MQEIKHPDIVHQQVIGKRLHIWVDINPDPHAADFDPEKMEGLIRCARTFMKGRALNELIFEKVVRN